jgi:tripartite-type tricarboxylate transporter receptor subunit TctC
MEDSVNCLRLILLAFASSLISSPTRAEYPERPITVVVPFPAGSPVDAAARYYSEALQKKFGRPVIVDNRVGAGGTIGTAFASRAKADGYTLLFTSSSTIVVAPAIYKELRYDPIKDLKPVVANNATGVVIEVNASLPVNSVAELIALARANPGKLLFASSGVGTVPHLAGEIFMQRTGIKLTHVPYKGSPAAAIDLIAGNVQIMFDPASNAEKNAQIGNVKILASVSPMRAPELPSVLTVAEAGVPEVEQPPPWFGLFVPAATSDAVTRRLEEVLEEGLATDDAKRQLPRFGIFPGVIVGAALKRKIAQDMELYRDLAREAKIQLQ